MKFDQKHLDMLWHWIYERQWAFYRRKVLRLPPPWSTDPIIQGLHFTNVYREIDPGTTWLVHNVLDNATLEPADRAFLALAYRLFGNETIFSDLGVPEANPDMLPGSFSEARLSASLSMMLKTGRRAFTAAYTVSNLGRKEPKPVVIAQALARIASDWGEYTWPSLRYAGSRKEAWQVLKGLYGVGGFVAFQTLVDLCYRLPSLPNALSFSNNDWVCAGPVAKLGLKLLVAPGTPVNDDTGDAIVAQLVRLHREPLEARGMKWLQDERCKPVYIDRSNMQNCLCEFSKYEYATRGGKGRVFDAHTARRRDQKAPPVLTSTPALLAAQLDIEDFTR